MFPYLTVGDGWNIGSTTHVTCVHFPFAGRKSSFALSVLIKRDILSDAMITDYAFWCLFFEAEEIHLDYGLVSTVLIVFGKACLFKKGQKKFVLFDSDQIVLPRCRFYSKFFLTVDVLTGKEFALLLKTGH